jgi:hypothetical protein
MSVATNLAMHTRNITHEEKQSEKNEQNRGMQSGISFVCGMTA